MSGQPDGGPDAATEAETPTEADSMRARAEQCRKSAREYSSEIGASLEKLATTLDEEAARLDLWAANDRGGA